MQVITEVRSKGITLPLDQDEAENRIISDNETDVTEDENVNEEAEGNMTEEESSSTAGQLDSLENPITEIYTADIPRKQLKQFEGLPDFFTKSDLPIPVAVKRDDTYWVISQFDKVAEVINSEENIRVLVYVLPDNSDLSIALEKWGYMDRPLGGGASAAEQIWMAAHLPSLISKDPRLKIISCHGGSRKGPTYVAESFLKRLIAKRLKQTESVAYKHIYYGKYIDIDTLKIFAEKKLERRFFESINTRKSGLLKSLEDKTDAEKTEQVSKNVLAWMNQYIADEATKAAKAAEDASAAKAARDAKAKEMKKAGVSKKAKSVVNVAVPVEPDNQPPSNENNGDEFIERPMSEVGDIPVTTHEKVSVQEEIPSASPFNFLPEPTKTSSDIFTEISNLGKKLTEISVKKPPKQELSQELRVILGSLNKIMTALAEEQDSSTATTLSPAT